MADAVASQTLHDGKRNAIIKLTNVSDGTGESAVTKVDVSALSGAPTSVRIDKIDFSTTGMSVNLLWDADTDVVAYTLPADFAEDVEFCDVGGLTNPKATGWTGDIKLSTLGHSANDTYSIVLHLKKKYG